MHLTLDNISKTYPNGTIALDNVTIRLEKGMFGLLGPNGAGKSSLMRTIATLQKPDKGSIHFSDIDVLDDPKSLRAILGYLPQSFGVYPNQSAESLLDYFAILKGISSRKNRKALVQHVLELTNLQDVKRKNVSGYSGGMKQRFGIAQLLLNNPKLIIVDEPTAGLDPAERIRFLNVLRDISSDNIVIFSTHLVEDVKDLSSDMAIMNDGKIKMRTSPNQATKEMEGKVWLKNIPKEELDLYKSQYKVLSSSFNQDDTLSIRVYSIQIPNNTFSLESKTRLEDVYFSCLNGGSI